MRAILACACLLAGCSGLPEMPSVAKVPVAQPCLNAADAPKLPAVKSNAELGVLADEPMVLTIAAERAELLSYALKADPVIRACAK